MRLWPPPFGPDMLQTPELLPLILFRGGSKVARRKPGDWNSRKKKKFKQFLFEKQGGDCPFCRYYFDITRLIFWYHQETETYYLVCMGCHP